MGVIRDISEEKKLERMKEDLIGMITHDLRNPVLSLERALQIVVGGTLGSLNPDQKNVMELALVTSHQLFGMVSDILDIYRNENGKLMLRCTEVRFQRVVEESLKQMELLTREKRITVQVEAPSAPLEVTVDEGRIHRTFVNLLDNAIKYSPEGGQYRHPDSRTKEWRGPSGTASGCPAARRSRLVACRAAGPGPGER